MSAVNRLATRAIRRMGAAGAGRPVSYPAGETAVVLVGTQRDLVRDAGAVSRLAALVRTARRAGLTVVHTSALPATPENGITHPTPSQAELVARGALWPGTPGAEVHPDLAPVAGDVVVAPHARVSAFGDGALTARLEELGVHRVVIAGARTEVEIDSTARDAVELGLQTTVVADCCDALTAAGHASTTATTLPRVVHRVCTLEEFERRLR